MEDNYVLIQKYIFKQKFQSPLLLQMTHIRERQQPSELQLSSESKLLVNYSGIIFKKTPFFNYFYYWIRENNGNNQFQTWPISSIILTWFIWPAKTLLGLSLFWNCSNHIVFVHLTCACLKVQHKFQKLHSSRVYVRFMQVCTARHVNGEQKYFREQTWNDWFVWCITRASLYGVVSLYKWK